MKKPLIILITFLSSVITYAQQAGTLDVSFGGTGTVSNSINSGYKGGKVAIQSDGKIIVAGSYHINTPASQFNPNSSDVTYYTFARYNQNGTLDNSFGTNGISTIFVSYSTFANGYGALENVVIQPDGKIVAVGDGSFGPSLVVRINSNGTLDNTFDGDGIKAISVVAGINISLLRGVAIQPNGKIVVVGTAYITNTEYDFAVIRINADGTLDLGFDGDGLQTTNFQQNDSPISVTVQSDGKIVVAGIDGSDLQIARYTSSGALDTSFDNDGKQTVNNAQQDWFPTVKIQADNKIVLGYAGNIGNFKFILTRLNTNGSLDLSFDGDGSVIATSENGYINDLQIQPDGKIIAIGGGGVMGNLNIYRYNPDGSLDFTFNGTGFYSIGSGSGEKAVLQADGKIVVGSNNNPANDGFVVIRLHGVSNFNSNNGKMITQVGTSSDQANAIAIRPNGKIITAGFAFNAINGASDNDFALIGYNMDGSLDYTFGNNAVVKTEISAFSNDQIKAISIQPDGKIVAAGTTGISTLSNYAIVRYLADGSGLDLTFGTGGRVIVDISSTQDFVSSILIQPDGKIVVGGSTVNGANADFSLIRLNPNGTLDTSFDGDGKVTTSMGASYNISSGIGLQADGKIVLAGYNAGNFGVVRYNSNGSLDNTFDADGKVNITIGSSSNEGVFGLVIQPDGKILVSGNTNFAGTNDFAIIRLNIDGTLDSGFGTGGKFWTDINANSEDFNPSIALHTSGKIVLAGVINTSTIGLCRLNANGTLDTGFDTDGKMTIEIGYGIDQVKAMAIQVDGKMLLAGNYNNGSNDDFALVRVNGVTDFSVNNGKMFTSMDFYDNIANSMVEQPDGKIVLGGYAKNSVGNNSTFALARYNTNGSLDNTFDGDGIMKTSFNVKSEYSNEIALQTDGKIVAVGTATNTDDDYALSRYNTDGSLDTFFGTGGKVITSVSANNDQANSVVVQPDGKIVIGGSSNSKFSLFRYNSNGTLDNTYGTNGSVVSSIGAYSYINKIALQADGKIIAAGFSASDGFNNDFTIARYTSAGVLDNTFNSSGIFTYDLGSNDDIIYTVAIQNDGKIVVGGKNFNISGFTTEFVFMRLNPNGSLDNTFDVDGKQIVSVGSGGAYLYKLNILPNGKILAAGQASIGLEYDIAVVRLNSNGSLDKTFDTDGKFTKPIGLGFDRAFSIIYQTNGNYLMGGAYFNGSNYDFMLSKVIPCEIETPVLVNSADNYPNATLPNPQIGKSITATNLVNSTANITYRTSSSITLNPGFKADNGAVFKTEIVGCSY